MQAMKNVVVFLFILLTNLSFSQVSYIHNTEEAGEAAKKRLKADYIKPFTHLEHTYIIRSKNNQKWGLYLYNNELFTEFLPMTFDEIIYDATKHYFILRQNDLYGIYNLDIVLNSSKHNIVASYDQIDTLYQDGLFLIYTQQRSKKGLLMMKEPYQNITTVANTTYNSLPKFEKDKSYVITESNNKKGLIISQNNSINTIAPIYDEIVEKNEKIYTKCQNGKWGLYDPYSNTEIYACVYSSQKDVQPDSSNYNINIRKYAHKHLNADLVHPIQNGDFLFRARNSHSKKWGLFQKIPSTDSSGFKKFVPMQYDSIVHLKFNNIFFTVCNNNKYGFYFKNKESVPCIYEDYKYVNLRDENKLYTLIAAQKDNKWGWIDWSTGEKLSEFKWNSFEELSNKSKLIAPKYPKYYSN